jgi:hypothetical protein
MNIMSIHIDETLGVRDIRKLKETLTAMSHVINVELNSSVPHDLMVEYEAHFNMPVIVLNKLSRQGLHSDMQLC